MKEALIRIIHAFSRLIDVKSIVTLSLVTVLSVLTLRGLPVPELFSSAVMLVLGFFFGKDVPHRPHSAYPGEPASGTDAGTNHADRPFHRQSHIHRAQ